MRMKTGTDAADSFVENVVDFVGGAVLALGVDFRKIAFQCFGNFLPALIREGKGFEGAHTDGFVFQYTPAEEFFDQQFLIGGEILCLVNHV